MLFDMTQEPETRLDVCYGRKKKNHQQAVSYVTRMREIPSHKSNNFFFKSPIGFYKCFRIYTNECIFDVWWS